MLIGLPVMALSAAILYFAVIGIRHTFAERAGMGGIIFLRDVLKYAALFLSIFFTYLGAAGLIGKLFAEESSFYSSKLDTARWLSLVVIGIPVLLILARWIRRDFSRNIELQFAPAWQLFLLFTNTWFFLAWFIPISNLITQSLYEKVPSQGIVHALLALLIWGLQLRLIAGQNSLMVNLHRTIGWFAGLATSAVGAINLLAVAIANIWDLDHGIHQFQESVIWVAIGAPVFIFYWSSAEEYLTELEGRVYHTFAGLMIPALFLTISATFLLNQILTWLFGNYPEPNWAHFADAPTQIALLVILSPILFFFRKLLQDFERDDITRAYEYLMAAASLVAAGVGLAAIIAGALSEFNTANGVIFGIALFVTTFPTWLHQWRKCQFAMQIDFEGEHHSPARRFYLYFEIGVPTIICIIAAVWVTYFGFKAWLVGGHLRDIRVPLGMITSAGLIALYHYRVFRAERD